MTTHSPATLDADSLQRLLRKGGSFPEKHRIMIWSYLLALPENRAEYLSLSSRGTHEAYDSIERVYPIKDRTLLERFRRTMSVLTHWSPICGLASYLPELLFPVVNVFGPNHLGAAEMCMTLLTNHFESWFTSFPHPPVDYLAMVQAVLRAHDPILVQTMVDDWRVSVTEYAWPLLRSLFTSVLHGPEWLKMMDHAVFAPPCWMVFFTAAYLHHCRASILKAGGRTRLLGLLCRHCAVDIDYAITKAHDWMTANRRDAEVIPVVPEAMYILTPLGSTSAGYPLFHPHQSAVEVSPGPGLAGVDPVDTDSDTTESEYY